MKILSVLDAERLLFDALRIGFFSAFLSILAPYGQGEEPAEKPAFGISISPTIIRVMGSPGETKMATVRVLNNSVIPVQVVTEANDVGNRVDENGRLAREFFPAGTLPYSCARWTLLRESEFRLEPDSFKDVDFLISAPEKTEGGFSCVVFFRGVPLLEDRMRPDATQTQATIQIHPRLGALVFYEIEGTVRRTGELLGFGLEPPLQGGPLRIFYIFKNTGNADLLVEGTFYILDAQKAMVTKGTLTPLRTFPGDEGSAESEWLGVLSPGDYEIVVTFELGPEIQEVIVKESKFTV